MHLIQYNGNVYLKFWGKIRKVDKQLKTLKNWKYRIKYNFFHKEIKSFDHFHKVNLGKYERTLEKYGNYSQLTKKKGLF